MPNYDYPDPFINTVFINDEKLYVCLFHNHTLMHYHFFYSLRDRMIIGNVISFKVGISKRNFPQKSFYNTDRGEIYTFYRQA